LHSLNPMSALPAPSTLDDLLVSPDRRLDLYSLCGPLT
jgi:hypothetical protein